MTKALDEILQKYFGCSVPFRKDGELTTTGEKAMRKLEELLSDLEGIGVIPSASDAVQQLDVIVKGEKPEEEMTELEKAIKYVHENMDEDDMAILKAEMNKCYKMHLIPGEDVMDCDKVIDLLEEYGDENDLPERWWESECEIDEILCKL